MEDFDVVKRNEVLRRLKLKNILRNFSRYCAHHEAHEDDIESAVAAIERAITGVT